MAGLALEVPTERKAGVVPAVDTGSMAVKLFNKLDVRQRAQAITEFSQPEQAQLYAGLSRADQISLAQNLNDKEVVGGREVLQNLFAKSAGVIRASVVQGIEKDTALLKELTSSIDDVSRQELNLELQRRDAFKLANIIAARVDLKEAIDLKPGSPMRAQFEDYKHISNAEVTELKANIRQALGIPESYRFVFVMDEEGSALIKNVVRGQIEIQKAGGMVPLPLEFRFDPQTGSTAVSMPVPIADAERRAQALLVGKAQVTEALPNYIIAARFSQDGRAFIFAESKAESYANIKLFEVVDGKVKEINDSKGTGRAGNWTSIETPKECMNFPSDDRNVSFVEVRPRSK